MIAVMAVVLSALVVGGFVVARSRRNGSTTREPVVRWTGQDVRAHLLELLRTSTARPIDDVFLGRSLLQNGIESLTVIAFCNRVQSSLGLSLEIPSFFGELSVDALVTQIEGQYKQRTTTPEEPAPVSGDIVSGEV